jgi:tetratricopeptide (TPR) repeat protein
VLCGAALFAQTTEEEWFKKAGEYFDSGNYANAVTAYSEVIKRNSSNINAYWFRSYAYYKTNNYDAAIADCNTVIKDAPDFPTVYVLRGDSYGAKGIYHTVVADYKAGLEKGFDPNGYDVDKSSKASMWFCGAMYMEIVVNRFLGQSAVVTKYENWLKTVCDKNSVTRAEVEAFYRQNIGALIAAVVDAEFKDITIVANTKTAIKQAITNFFLTPNQTNYNGLKRYKYPDGRPHFVGIVESNIKGDLHNIGVLERAGMKGATEALRKSVESSRDLLNTMKTANAYIYALRALSPALADKVLQESP